MSFREFGDDFIIRYGLLYFVSIKNHVLNSLKLINELSEKNGSTSNSKRKVTKHVC